MSNERLERIKERVNYHGHLDDDIEFLIEQAKKNMTCQEVLELQKDALKGLLKQNKRYREALEFYALGRHWITSLKDGRDYVNEYGELAEKTLEELE